MKSNDQSYAQAPQLIKNLLADSGVERHKNKMVAVFIVLRLRERRINTHQDIIDEINRLFNLRTKTQRLMDWRSHVVSCPRNIATYMQQYILSHVFAKKSSADLEKILNISR